MYNSAHDEFVGRKRHKDTILDVKLHKGCRTINATLSWKVHCADPVTEIYFGPNSRVYHETPHPDDRIKVRGTTYYLTNLRYSSMYRFNVAVWCGHNATVSKGEISTGHGGRFQCS